MANKSTSLNSIKTCFNKIKTWVSGENKKLEEKIEVNRQTIGYESRNLLPYPEQISVGGITFKFDSDGYMTGSNTSSDTRLYTHGNAQQHVFLKKGRYCVTFFAKTPATNAYANIVLLDKNDTFVCMFGNKDFANKEKDMIYFSLDSDKEVYVVAKPFDGVIAIQIQLANAQTDDTYQPYTPTVNDRLSVLEGLIKKKIITKTSTASGNIDLGFSDDNTIILLVVCPNTGYIALPYSYNKKYFCHLSNNTDVSKNVANVSVEVTIYYIDISNYIVQNIESTSLQSDKMEDNLEVLQSENKDI